MTDAQRAELIRRYQLQLVRTATMVGTAAQEAWARLGSWDRKDIARLADELAPLAGGAQAHAAALAAALAAMLKTLTVPTITPVDEIDWSPAFHSYWGSLSTNSWEDALLIGGNAAAAVGFDGVQYAARDAARQVDAREPAITAWERVPDGEACDWCIEVAGQTYHSAESADFGHDRCGCSVVPA